MIDAEILTRHYSSLIFLLCGSFINILYMLEYLPVVHHPKLFPNKNQENCGGDVNSPFVPDIDDTNFSPLVQ